MPKKILFFRDFQAYAGGHGKVWDYFNHCRASARHSASIRFSPESRFDDSNPWYGCPELRVDSWSPDDVDGLFVAGMDWLALDGVELPPGLPIVNLVQGIRHTDPALPLRGFLSRPATRICVSQAVADAVLATGEVNGPVFVIPAGLELPPLPAGLVRTDAIFLGALKQPELGRRLAEGLRARGHEVFLADRPLPRAEFLTALARAGLAVLLPCTQEGFFLPGLEAMALGTALVMPDAGGNRAYARAGENCLLTDWSLESMLRAVEAFADANRRGRCVAAGYETARRHSLAAERSAFLRLLTDLGLG